MMRIKSVSIQADRAGKYAVVFEDGTVMRLYRQTIEDFDLYSGQELLLEEMVKLRDAAGAMSARMRAVRIVAATNISTRDLEQRLIQKGENPRQAKDAVAWMENLQLVDDQKTAEQIVQKCIHKGYGLARARQTLYEKRIPKEYWESVLADYPDQTEHIVSYLTSHLTEKRDEKNLRRVMDALLRRGHSYHEIRRGLEQVAFSTDEFPED